MSKKVATAPCTTPSCSTGCDQYSTGNEVPSRRRNARVGDVQLPMLAVWPAHRAAPRESPPSRRRLDQHLDLAAEQLGLRGRSRASRSAARLMKVQRPCGVDAVQALGGGVEQPLQRLLAAPHFVFGQRLQARAAPHEGERRRPRAARPARR